MVLLGVSIAGCGASTQSTPAPAISEMYLETQLNVTGTFGSLPPRLRRLGLRRRQVGTQKLLVPPGLFTGALMVEAPPMLAGGPSPNLRHVLAATSAEIDRPHRVELIAQGQRGAEIQLSWQESCGAQRLTPEQAATQDRGGQLVIIAQLPLLVLAPQPEDLGAKDRCYLREEATAAQGSPTPTGTVSLVIVNY